MDKREFKTKTFIMSAVMLVYLLAIISGNQLWGNIASPLVAFVACYFLWTAGKYDEYRLNWVIMSMMAFSWGFTDTLWMVASDIYGLTPNDMPIFMYLYIIPNVLMTTATFMYLFNNMKRWHTVQLVLDLSTSLIVIFLFVWQSLLKDFNFLLISYDDIIGTFSYLITDILSLSVVLVLYGHMKSRKISKTLYMLIAGIIMYSLADIHYTYLIFEDKYAPNTIIDYIYMIAIALFAYACLYEAYKPTPEEEEDYSNVPEKVGKSFKYILLLLLPVVFYMTGFFDINNIVKIVVILTVYQIISSFVQGNVRNEIQLKKEKKMNEKLEDIISERTRDLLQANKALDELARIDTLTGLYNRRYFLEEIDKEISAEDNKFSVFYMDLDRFKTINDTHGHDMGDQLLIVISERLNTWKAEYSIVEDAMIARLGGDEFSVLLKGDISCDQLELLCIELIDLVNEPIVIDPYIFNIGVSIGVSRYPVDAEEREQLMKYSDIAMYNAKKKYGNMRYTLFNKSQSDIIQKRNEIEMLLKNADFDKEFELNFQPQFRIEDNRLIGAEALLRWNSPVKGRISPVEFIPIAEETGIILTIGSWVMKKAINQIGLWNEKYNLNLIMGINISPKQIESVDFLSSIRNTMDCIALDPKWIDFEITESSAMNTNVIMEEILTGLSGIGINISIDDFGTGYSSLSYIKRFDIDRLKIAKELIDNISSNRNALLIVKAIVMMAKGLNLLTIAEGVETEEQLNLLRMLGCDQVQGFLLGRPVAASVFEHSFLENDAAIAQNA